MNYERLGLLVADQITAMLAYWDSNQVCRYANKAYLEWFGTSAEKMINHITLEQLLGPLYEKNLPHIRLALSGQIQVFEREIRLPDGSVRQSLASYIPDIHQGEVHGFFVHVADVTHIKNLEKRIIQLKKEMLANIIHAQENEKATIAELLRQNINQTLVCAKVMISNLHMAENHQALLPELEKLIHDAIEDLEAISLGLSPTLINDLGFTAGIESFLENFRQHHAVPVKFLCTTSEIDQLDKTAQVTIFRIIQDFLLIATKEKSASFIQININQQEPHTELILSLKGTGFSLQTDSREFSDLVSRTEYLSGELTTFDSSPVRGYVINIPLR